MALKTSKQLAPVRPGINCFGYGNKADSVTIHQTGNTNKGANAKMHAKLQSGVYGASWQWQVDDVEAIQSFENNVSCYHASDGRGPGNLNSIAIEGCINVDGDYVKTVHNMAELAAIVLKEIGKDTNSMFQHNHFDTKYRKNCPAQIRAGKDGINWALFVQMVKDNMNDKTVSKPVKLSTSKTIDQLANEVIAGKHGSGDARKKALGSQFDAVQAKVNEMLGGNKTVPAAKSIDTLVKETIAGVHGNGDARKKSLGSNYDAVMKVINGSATHQAAPKRKHVYLPKSAKTWRVYKTSGPYTVGKEVGLLAPAQYGGLNYEIIKTLATDVYQIKTGAFGNVAIYAAKSTGATIK